MERVRLIDDDVELCELVSELLAAEGFAVECVHDGVAGVQRGLSARFALLILVCRNLPQAQTPAD